MTHWAKKLGLAAALSLALGIFLPSTASADPSFCRSGAGHPVHGREWCVNKGFALGGRSYVHYDRYRYRPYDYYRSHDRYRPSWSYSPYYRSDWGYRDWRGSNNGYRYGRDYRDPDYRRGYRDGLRSAHRHDRNCRH